MEFLFLFLRQAEKQPGKQGKIPARFRDPILKIGKKQVYGTKALIKLNSVTSVAKLFFFKKELILDKNAFSLYLFSS